LFAFIASAKRVMVKGEGRGA